MENKNLFRISCRGIILHEGELLAVQNSENGFYSLPGGTLEPGETIMNCVERELIEELGVKPEIGKLLSINEYTGIRGTPAVDFIFEIKNGKDFVGCEKLERSHAHEIAGIAWLSPDGNFEFKPKQLAEFFKNNELLKGEIRFISH